MERVERVERVEKKRAEGKGKLKNSENLGCPDFSLLTGKDGFYIKGKNKP